MGHMLNAEEGLRPLTALLQVAVPECQCVFSSMLSSWYMVKDRQSKLIYLLYSWLVLHADFSAVDLTAYRPWWVAS